ncbi:MAG: helix-turn-helix transcriptional regulator [Solirubrobacterales bacterium]|nr:helix-turn-helix transcriptional regulator [Solirubrobacterales bacterium]
MDAARQILSERGLRALTLDEVARRSFFARSSIYVHFAGKPGLVEGLVVRCIEDLAVCADLFCSGSDSPSARLHRALLGVGEILVRDDAVITSATRLVAEDPIFAARFWPSVAAMLDALAARVVEDQIAGLARTDLPARVAIDALVPVLTSLRPSSRLYKPRLPLRVSSALIAKLSTNALYREPSVLESAPAVTRPTVSRRTP